MRSYLFIFGSVLILSVFSCQEEKPIAICHTENLRIRQSPNANSDIIGKLSKDEKVIYLSEWGDSLQAVIDNNILNEKWLKIETDSGIVGWVFSGGLTGDISFISLERFNNKSNIKDSLLYVPFGKKVNLYKSPYLASSIVKEVNEPIALIVDGEAEINFENVGIKRNWIKIISKDNTALYVLKSNLIKESNEPSALNDFEESIKKFGEINSDGFYMFKSVKEYENGDDGAVWTEESDLIFDFENKSIVTGYMYTREFHYFSDVKFRDGKYIFIEGDENLSLKENLSIKLLSREKLEFINAGYLSGIYIPGKARNF